MNKIALALILAAKQALTPSVKLQTRSNSHLRVYFQGNNNRFNTVYLEGDARVIYQGHLWSEAWDY